MSIVWKIFSVIELYIASFFVCVIIAAIALDSLPDTLEALFVLLAPIAFVWWYEKRRSSKLEIESPAEDWMRPTDRVLPSLPGGPGIQPSRPRQTRSNPQPLKRTLQQPPEQPRAATEGGCLGTSSSLSRVARSMGWSMLALHCALVHHTMARSVEPTSIHLYPSRGPGRTRMAITCHIGRAIQAFLPFAGPPISIGWLVVAKVDQSTPATCSCSSMVWSGGFWSMTRQKAKNATFLSRCGD